MTKITQIVKMDKIVLDIERSIAVCTAELRLPRINKATIAHLKKELKSIRKVNKAYKIQVSFEGLVRCQSKVLTFR